MRRKRARKRKADEIQIVINNDEQIQQSGDGPFITDVPKSVAQEILLKLPIKSILMCKIVCKTWHADHPIRAVDTEIHTLGTHSWKAVGSSPLAEHMKSPIYLKGALYWYNSVDSIASFDMDNELFQSVPPLPFQVDSLEWGMGVLGESLSVCATHDNQMDVWEVEGHGVQMSWRKKVYNDMDVGGRQSWPQGLYVPLKVSKDGALLMFKRDTDALVYYHPRRNYRSILYLDLKIRGRYREGFEVILHVPSLISLKDILIDHDPEVLNVYSRCAEYKLPRETRGLQLKTLWW